MKVIVVSVSTGYVGAKREIEFSVEDDATEEEIEEMAKEAMFSLIDWNFWEKE